MPYYKITTTGYEVGNKPHGAEWKAYTVGSEPAELKVLMDAEDNEKTRVQAKADRDDALNAMVHTLADGSVVQTRPSDLTNFQISIDVGVTSDWVLADNTVRPLTVAEMQECLNSGISKAKVIWATYTDFLKGL